MATVATGTKDVKQERDKKTLRIMIGIYCRRKEGNKELCARCRELLAYAEQRIEHCPLGNAKVSCRVCTIHCYSPEMGKRIRIVMRYSGPRMMLYAPITALRHLLRERKHR